jgi:hypothetical protein
LAILFSPGEVMAAAVPTILSDCISAVCSVYVCNPEEFAERVPSLSKFVL